MSQTYRNKYTSGPRSFGMSARSTLIFDRFPNLASWFDSGDRSLPGPGQHQNVRMNKTNPPGWRIGNSTQRDSFLEKQYRPNPSPNNYQPKYQPTKVSIDHIVMRQNQSPSYSIPRFTDTKSSYLNEDNGKLIVNPDYKLTKTKYPLYSMGYSAERDYSTCAPAPNQYNHHLSKTQNSFFNRTQHSFSTSDRPLPYGQHAKYPGVSTYDIDQRPSSQSFSIGVGNRTNPTLAKDSPGVFYEIQGNMRKSGGGKTFGPQYPASEAKKQDFPAPNNYNPTHIGTKRNIITSYSNREPMENNAVVKYPSPQKYSYHREVEKKSLSFCKQTRDHQQSASKNPGPGQHDLKAELKTTSGVMGKKLKDPEPLITPAADHYSPDKLAIAQSSPRVVNLYSNRVDFSKSLTGRKVGPGSYKVDANGRAELGKMSKSMKFPKNYDKNPGPGSYHLPNGIGQLPKYYSGSKKITNDGYSTFTVRMWEQQKRDQARKEQQGSRKQSSEKQEA